MAGITTTTHSFKISLVGRAGVGKTTWLKRLRTGEFDKKWITTLNVEVHSIKMKLVDPRGRMHRCTFQVWDLAGQDKFGGLVDHYHKDSDACVAMFEAAPDLSTEWNSKAELERKWIPGFKRVAGEEKPVLMVANRKDESMFTGLAEGEIEISVKRHHDLFRPLVVLARKLTGIPELQQAR